MFITLKHFNNPAMLLRNRYWLSMISMEHTENAIYNTNFNTIKYDIENF